MPNTVLLHQLLKKHWGFDAFRPLQEDIIRSVLNGQDTLALLPTGGGKSICFQIPALVTDGICIVVSPLIALIKDQVANLNKREIKAAAIYSGMNSYQIDSILDNCIYGDTKFLYVSPERLGTELFKARVEKMKVNLIAVDEAHCISQWGYDFRPAYLQIAELKTIHPAIPIIALTATATKEVGKDIQQQLQFKEANVFQQSFVRQNLSYVVRKTENKNAMLLDILKKVKGSSIVYVHSRRQTKEVADWLNKNKLPTLYYHAGLNMAERSEKQQKWSTSGNMIMVSTNAFGMGIDKPNVRTVVHYDPADSLEAYFQEAGRAGRDGKKAFAVQLIDETDQIALAKKLAEQFPAVEELKTLYDTLCRHFGIAAGEGAESLHDFDITHFCAKYNYNPIRVLLCLSLLEQQKVLISTDAVSQSSQVKIIVGKEVLYKFQVEHKNTDPLLKFLLRNYAGIFEQFVDIQEGFIAKRLNVSYEEFMQQLRFIEQSKILAYSPAKDKPQLFFLQSRVPKEELKLDTAFLKKRREIFEQKLGAVQRYVENETECRSKVLVNYFGEENSTDCQVCDICINKRKSTLTKQEFNYLCEEISERIKHEAITFEELANDYSKYPHSTLMEVINWLFDNEQIIKSESGKYEWNH